MTDQNQKTQAARALVRDLTARARAHRLATNQRADGSLLIYEPERRGYVRVEPPDVGTADEVAIIPIRDVNGRPRRGDAANVSVTWDEGRSEYALRQSSDSLDVAGEVWRCMAAAVDSSWTWPR
jgi:hypothetical protein